MARGKGKARRGKGRGGNSAQSRNDDAWRSDVVEKSDMHNERLEKYYKAQNILPETEWEPFMQALREPLPTTFRVAGSRQTAQLLNETIKDTHVPHLAGVVFEGEAVSPPKQIPWYPDGLAWVFNVSKKVLRKSPEFKKFHNFLVFETEVGNISRQEAVSMLPPLFLGVEPHHRVIDMCAAPGSKTAQLLEALHAHDTATASSYPSGLLIANDSDHKRTHLLIHQSARLPSPALMVTNHDASIYPAIKIPSEVTVFPAGTKQRVASKRQHQLLFDRILCDVPCSGDGTMRKNPGIWKNWSPMDGNGLHGLQIRILQRAMRMLKKGGRIVYSTCSLNPVENEAVIIAALKSVPGFELIDVSNQLPGLIYRPGLTSWKPTTDRLVETAFATYEEYIQSLPEDKRDGSKMTPSHWPPTPTEADELHLERCLRIYPHLQDTGGFFIAVLEKVPAAGSGENRRPLTESIEGKRPADAVEDLEVSELKKPKLSDDTDGPFSEAIEPDDVEEDNGADLSLDPGTAPEMPLDPNKVSPANLAATTEDSTSKSGKAAKGADIHFKENPYTFISHNDPIIQGCISKFNLKPDFPASNVLVRNPEGEPARSLYMTNDIVKDIVQHNDYTRIRLMTCGTKVLAKQESSVAKREGTEPQFRLLGEGLPVMLPYIESECIIDADLPALKILMEGYYPVISGFSEPFRSVIEARATGSHVVRFKPELLGNASRAHELILPIWKSAASVTLMIEKRAKSALSLRVFGEDITTAAREAAQKRQPAGPETQSEAPANILPPGDNSRHVDFATDHLQQKIVKMEARMRLLEDAVQVAQMQQSNEQHPLLRTPFQYEPEEDSPEGEVEAMDQPDDLADALGSLHINEKDKSMHFYGGAESLLKHEGSKRPSRSLQVPDSTTPMALRALGLPPEFDVFFLSFPFTPMGIPREPVRVNLETLLPPRIRAEELIEIFMENLSWMFQIVTLSYLRDELVPAVYKRAVGDPKRREDYNDHDLALLLIVLAIGALVDLTQRPYNAEAHRYAALARTSAGLQPLMEDISLATVKFTHLLSIYNGMCGKESAVSNTYALANLASVMGQKIGLHMDPSVWNLDEKTSYRRRAYFWNLLQADVWMCLSSGRPPSISNSGAHCKIPTEEEERKFQVGEKLMGFLLFLHRAFFAKAIATHPDNPFNSPYSHSFKTAYHCACVMLRTTKYQYGLYPALMSRVWQIWTFAFTSAVIVGAVATRTHLLDMEPPPLQMFDDACELFREASAISPRAAKGLPVLMSMHEKASRLHRSKGKQPMNPSTLSSMSPGSSSMDHEVAIFAGKSRVVAQTLASPSPFPIPSQLPPPHLHQQFAAPPHQPVYQEMSMPPTDTHSFSSFAGQLGHASAQGLSSTSSNHWSHVPK
ncbi:hypothetical protein EIP91_010262 [Steccherinum ochraceum]|uniref:SAM-dependent MTase RsmB/NOP-type domain-containing protein n=1 Tax=Steccherinum ochraceum TaxID=92696 RepID=A0A4R0R0S7_9APHY|nr:hypothetical protein EIP91_010262 [Steccherinum ochraceum]